MLLWHPSASATDPGFYLGAISMTQFGIGFAFWVLALFIIRASDKRSDGSMSTSEAAYLAVCMAYFFWGIGWALAWVADVIKLAVT